MPSRAPGTLHVLTRPPMLLLHVVAILAVTLSVVMGQWQIGAWQAHRVDRAAEIADAEPVPLAEVMGPDDPFPADGLGRPVELSGRWQPDLHVLVADRMHDGVAGFWAVSAVTVCAAGESCSGAPALPVVLGWSATRAEVPDPPTGPVDAAGWLQPGEASGSDTDPTDDVLPTLRIAALLERADGDLYGGYLILREPRADRAGLEAVTPESLPKAPAFTALRNLLYGVEWWFFALVAAFLWWRWSRDEVQRRRGRGSERVKSLSEPAEAGQPPAPARIPSEP